MGDLDNNLVAYLTGRDQFVNTENVKMCVSDHIVKISNAFNHPRNNPITQFYEHFGKQVGSF
jgi:hypothetical protein